MRGREVKYYIFRNLEYAILPEEQAQYCSVSRSG